MALTLGTLKDLVSDLNHFLGEMLLSEKLTAAAQKMRESLVQRLVLLRLSELVPVSESACFSTSAQVPPGHMLPHLNGNEDETEDLYEAPDSSMEEQGYEEFPTDAMAAIVAPVVAAPPPKLSPTVPSESDSGSDAGQPGPSLPAEAMTASSLRNTAAKHGPLYRKDRFIFVEQFRRCWAAVSAHYLFLFSSDKDSKPIVTHLLHNYEARPAPHFVKDAKKKELCFELVSPGRKTHQFIARTQKDMHQWIAAINAEAERRLSIVAATAAIQTASSSTDAPDAQTKRNSAGHKRVRRLPSLPDSDNETYNEAIGVSTIEDDSASSASEVQYEMMNSDEEIYYNIEDVQPISEQPAQQQQPNAEALPSRIDRSLIQQIQKQQHQKQDKQDQKQKQQLQQQLEQQQQQLEQQRHQIQQQQQLEQQRHQKQQQQQQQHKQIVTTPTVPYNEEEEDQYDDVLALQDRDSYYNVSQSIEVPPPPAVISLAPRPATRPPNPPSQSTKIVQEEDGVYDDVITDRGESPVTQASCLDRQNLKQIPNGQAAKPLNVPANKTKLTTILNTPQKIPKPPVQSAKPLPFQATKQPSLPNQSARPPANFAKSPMLPVQLMKNSGLIQTQKLPTPPEQTMKPTMPQQRNKFPIPPAKAMKPAVSQQTNSPSQLHVQAMKSNAPAKSTNSFRNSNSGHIQNLIKQMGASMIVKTPLNSTDRPNLPARNAPTVPEELYEPVDQDEFIPQLPPRPN